MGLGGWERVDTQSNELVTLVGLAYTRVVCSSLFFLHGVPLRHLGHHARQNKACNTKSSHPSRFSHGRSHHLRPDGACCQLHCASSGGAVVGAHPFRLGIHR